MSHRVFRRAALAAAGYCVAASALAASSPSMSGTVLAQAHSVAQHYQTYGQVEPIAVTQVRAVEAGVVERLVLPGERVTAGQVLAVLGGPQAEALRTERRGALRAASIQLAADAPGLPHRNRGRARQVAGCHSLAR